MPPASDPSRRIVARRIPALDDIGPVEVAEAFRDLPGLALLESARTGRSGRWSYLTADPVEMVTGSTPGRDPFAAARLSLARLGDGGQSTEEAAGGDPPPPLTAGLVGYLAYDLGRRFELLPAVARDDQGLPDLRLALHPWTIAWDHRHGHAWLSGRPMDGDEGDLARRLADVERRAVAGRPPVGRRPAPQPPAGRAPTVRSPQPRPAAGLRFRSETDRAGWRAAVAAIRAAIAAGELYQANLARRLWTPFDGDPWALFEALRSGEPSAFGAYLDLGRADPPAGRRAILSASPEPFLSLDAAGHVQTDPIKGTRPRGETRPADRALAADLLTSAKDRAENMMIVDVLRNDLGRVCRPGSVRVPRLCRLERTSSVQHLVSTVSGRLRPGLDAFDLVAAAMPGGSVTGAPKIRAMGLIEELEPVRRGPYCGAATWFDASGAMGSSILIRTFVADGGRLTVHVGGGITWRSDPDEEWEETRAKARGPLRAIGATEEAEDRP